MRHIKRFNESNEMTGKSKWWEENHQKLIALDIPYEDWEILVKDKEDFEGVYNSTAKHKALYLFNTYSIDELENIINDYNFDDLI